ncbi:hypothetical protein AJ79_03813 [Helicocarpus griseus UAMH5409]|uniref:W2 domain-containing protein n=1 Tax=Helicocarpus griseus UAMH5409 TaxID=1447875 RepID=A0A2B7XNA1_9EURO|nr:hypothetical protein AJ79_03813 [Helicocarpus griseus UAMH5409]
MATINIRRDNPDPFYRYKMERLQAKIEGKGNGIKTVVVNLNNVAQSLGRPPAYLIKYFGFELGAQANAKPSDDRWIINGAHDAHKLQDYLDGFIAKFVLCKKCKNPETEVVIKEPRIILDCKACGERSDVDLRQKLSTFILKNQPKKGKKDKSTKKTRKERNKGKGDGETNGEANGSPADSNSVGGHENGDGALEAHSDDELTRRINAEANEIQHTQEIDDDDWTVDVSAEAVKARAQELPSNLRRSLAFDGNEKEGEGENPAATAYDRLGSWIISSAKEHEEGVSGVSDIDICEKAKELGIESRHKTLAVLAQTIFDDKAVEQISPRASMLQEMITSERHERAFLGGTERLVVERPNLLASLPTILLNYYKKNIVSKKILKSWGAKASKKYVDISKSKEVREEAKEFLKWLNEAMSDEDETTKDDEELMEA